ncbi:hypothetical protein BCR35DRAFT_298336, partial [Leucosporidium creatinivorum]
TPPIRMSFLPFSARRSVLRRPLSLPPPRFLLPRPITLLFSPPTPQHLSPPPLPPRFLPPLSRRTLYPSPEWAASSDADSDDTLYVDESDIEAAIDDVVQQAHKLGEDGVMLEKVELGRVEEAEEPAEDFVV